MIRSSSVRPRALLGALVCLSTLVLTPPAHAQTQSDLDRARREASQIKSRLQEIAEAFAEADAAQDRTEKELSETAQEIRDLKKDMASIQGQLKDRIRAAYKMGGLGFFELLLEARSFRDFQLRLFGLQRQTLADEDLVLQLRKKRAELDSKEAELSTSKRVLTDRVSAYEAQARRANASLQEANALVGRLKGQLSRQQIARLFRPSASSGGMASAGGRAVGMSSCPLDAPNVVTNSFGAPRGGGTRRHQGNDIMAAYGIPVRAVNSGTITRTGTGGLGGLSIYLWDGSTEYYYAHLSQLKVSSGQKVSAGQLVGNNGDSGNASGGPPHVHFEIHPGGGGAIDPYPSLSRVC